MAVNPPRYNPIMTDAPDVRSRARGPWRRLQARLRAADIAESRLLIALDFDGTLSELAETPAQAVLSPRTRALLTLLARRPDTKVAIVSGRALDDVRKRAGLPGLYYAGNHGLEIRGPGIRWSHPRASRVSVSVRRALENDLRGIPGLQIEDKRLGFAVHYRRVPLRFHARLRMRIQARLPRLDKRYRVLHGKKVYDFRLNFPWDKARAVQAIRRTLPGVWTSVFVGDDATDEEAFATLGPRALTVRVGRVSRSAAQHVLPSRRLVDLLLERLARRPAARPLRRDRCSTIRSIPRRRA